MKPWIWCVGLLLGNMFSMNASALPPQNFFRFVRIDSDDRGQLYLATNRGLYLKSKDDTPWREISPSGTRQLHVQALLLNERGEIATRSGSATYILRKGASKWEVLSDIPGISQLWATGDTFFALGNGSQLWRADSGRWVRMNDSAQQSDVDVTGLAWIWGKFFLATNRGLLESPDGRQWWLGPDAAPLGAPEVLISTQKQWLYTSSHVGTPGHEHLPSIFVRHDAGGTWRRFAANAQVDHRTYEASLLAANGAVSYVKLTGGAPVRERWFRVQGGERWSEIDLAFAKGQGNLWQLLATRDYLYALTDGVIYRSADGINRWETFLTISDLPLLPY